MGVLVSVCRWCWLPFGAEKKPETRNQRERERGMAGATVMVRRSARLLAAATLSSRSPGTWTEPHLPSFLLLHEALQFLFPYFFYFFFPLLAALMVFLERVLWSFNKFPPCHSSSDFEDFLFFSIWNFAEKVVPQKRIKLVPAVRVRSRNCETLSKDEISKKGDGLEKEAKSEDTSSGSALDASATAIVAEVPTELTIELRELRVKQVALRVRSTKAEKKLPDREMEVNWFFSFFPSFGRYSGASVNAILQFCIRNTCIHDVNKCGQEAVLL